MKQKGLIFLIAIYALYVLRDEIESESTTHPKHVKLAKRIDKFCDELMDAARGR